MEHALTRQIRADVSSAVLATAESEEADFVVMGSVTAQRRTGGWWYGTPRYDAGAAATFTVTEARFAPPHPQPAEALPC